MCVYIHISGISCISCAMYIYIYIYIYRFRVLLLDKTSSGSSGEGLKQAKPSASYSITS